MNAVARLLIDGAQEDGESTVPVSEPVRGALAFHAHIPSRAQVEAAVQAARRAFDKFGDSPAHQKADILRAAASGVASERDAFIEEMVSGVGKAYASAKGEVDRAFDTLTTAAEEALRITGFEVPMDASPRGEGRVAFARRYPVGVVAAITPFNSPLNTVCHKLAPAFAAGNTVVLKPDLGGGTVAVRLARIFSEAGLPAGALNVLHGDGDIGEQLVRHPGVDLITFTGSNRTGERITAVAGLKKVLLELGGNAPVIVHHDADVSNSVQSLIPASFGLSGQSCISVQRLYVHESIFDTFLRAFLAQTEALLVGDPSDPDTDVGPLVNEAAALRIEAWINEAAQQGAQVLCGGTREGSYIRPTVLTNVTPEMKTVCMEVFGPVVNVIPYSDIDEAIDAANATPYGLQAGLFTNSMDVVMKAMRKLRFGGIIVNGPSRWRLDHMPYGGVKRSGIGREGPKFAIEDMTELRMIVLN